MNPTIRTRRGGLRVIVPTGVLLLAMTGGLSYKLGVRAATPPPLLSGALDVLLVQHTYDGVVESTGKLMALRYGASAVRFELTMDGDGDGIFRQDFECKHAVAGWCFD